MMLLSNNYIPVQGADHAFKIGTGRAPTVVTMKAIADAVLEFAIAVEEGQLAACGLPRAATLPDGVYSFKLTRKFF